MSLNWRESNSVARQEKPRTALERWLKRALVCYATTVVAAGLMAHALMTCGCGEGSHESGEADRISRVQTNTLTETRPGETINQRSRRP